MLHLKHRNLICFLVAAALCAHAATTAAAPATTTGRSGEAVFQSYCTECHSTGISGAPRISDKPAWASRLTQGQAALEQHALHGFKSMPARGSCSACSDTEIKAAVEFIVNKVK